MSRPRLLALSFALALAWAIPAAAQDEPPLPVPPKPAAEPAEPDEPDLPRPQPRKVKAEVQVVELTVKEGGAEVRAGDKLLVKLKAGTKLDSLKEKEGNHLVATRGGKKGWVSAEDVDAETVRRVVERDATDAPAAPADGERPANEPGVAKESGDYVTDAPNKRLTATFTEDGRVVVRNKRTQAEWTLPARGAAAYKTPIGTFSSDSSAVIFATTDKMLRCVSAADGKTLWTARLDCDKIDVPAVIAEGNSVSVLAGGVLYQFEAKTGKQLSRVNEADIPVGDPPADPR